LNINSKILFLFCFIGVFLFANENLYTYKSLESKSEVLIPLLLKKGEFINAKYKASAEINSFDILDENKKIVKKLYKFERLDNSFYFISNKTQKYFFKLITGKKKISFTFEVLKKIETSVNKSEKNTFLSKIISSQNRELHKNKDTTSFWKMVKEKGTPLIEHIKNDDYIVTFLYKGAKNNVRLLGGPISDHVELDRLQDSDIWYKSFRVQRGIRMSYQLAPDVPNINGSKREKRMAILATLQADEFNKTPYEFAKKQFLDKYSMFSTFEIKKNNLKDWGKEEGSKKGKVLDYEIFSKILKNKRRISIYKPDSFNEKKEHDILFIFDGKDYQIKVPTPLILDNLIASKKIKPTVAIFIDNPSGKARASELPSNKSFANFMAKELLPFVKSKININHKANNTILTGSSYGGLASTFVAFTYPEIFGKVLSQSGSFWWSPKDEEPEWLTRQIAKNKVKNIKFYLNAGKYETGYFSIDILESNRHLRTVLNSKNYKVFYEEFLTGHDYYSWKVNLARGLIKLSKF